MPARNVYFIGSGAASFLTERMAAGSIEMVW
jgi:hypothetical protein